MIMLCIVVLLPQVAVLLGTVVMCASSVVLLLSRNQIGRLFSSEHGVVMLTAQAVPPLAVSLIGEREWVQKRVPKAANCTASQTSTLDMSSLHAGEGANTVRV